MAAKPKVAAQAISHDQLEEQVQAFLKAGRKIEEVPAGVSGMEISGVRKYTANNTIKKAKA